MTFITTEFLANNAVDNTKIRLPSGLYLRSRNNANTADISILATNTSDRIVFGSIPQYPASLPTPSAPADIVNFAYLSALPIPTMNGQPLVYDMLGAAYGVAPLGPSGKIDVGYLPADVFVFQGQWNPNTNLPALIDGTGTAGYVYWVSVAYSGTVVGLTHPSMVNFNIGDLVIYNGTQWELTTPAAGVQSVNGMYGAVTVNAINQLTSDVTTSAATGSQSLAATIANNAVTNAKAAQMAANTLKGNNTGSTANASDLTATQATAMLNVMVGDSGSGGTQGLVPAPGAGTYAAGDYLSAGGSWAYVDQSKYSYQPFALLSQTANPAALSKINNVLTYKGVNGKTYAVTIGAVAATISIYDVTNQAAPVMLSSMASLEGSYNAVYAAIGGVDYIIVASSGGYNLYIVNVSNPSLPTITTTFGLGSSTGSSYNIAYQNGMVYLATQSQGLKVVDIGNGIGGGTLTSPVVTYTQGGGAKSFGVAVTGTTLYTTQYSTSPYATRLLNSWTLTGAGTVGVPSMLQSLTLPGLGETLAVSINSNTAFVSNTIGVQQLDIVDITTPSSMTNLTSVTMPSGYTIGPAMVAVPVGNFLFMPIGANSTYGGAIAMYDITNRSSPILVNIVTTGVATSPFGGISIFGNYIFAGDYGPAPGSTGTLDIFSMPFTTPTMGAATGSSLTLASNITQPNFTGSAASGGNATISGMAAATSGTGGAVTISAGAGGTTSGAGGAVSIIGGAGSSTSGNGGNISVTGGAAGATSANSAGTVTISGGAGSTATVGGAGGGVTISGANATGNNTQNNAGGAISITSGSGNGNNGGASITLTPGTGGIGTGTAGAQGGNLNLNSGTGGAGSATSGTGGSLSIQAGSGGAGVGGGNGGTSQLFGGNGGAGSSTGGNGGAVTVQGGTAAAVANANGGNATVQGGSASSTGAGGNGGSVNIQGGNANGNNTANQNGGAISISAGTSFGSGTGGTVTINSGTGGIGTGTAGATGGTTNVNGGTGGAGSATSGNGGGAALKAGSGGNGVAGGQGGQATLQGGTGGTGSSSGGTGGAAQVNGGSPGSVAGATGGSVTIAASGGTSTGSGGNGGAVTITSGSANAGDNSVNRSPGNITITSGVGGGQNNGGNLTASAGIGGTGGSVSTTGGNGGTTAINAGAGGNGSATGGTGGSLQLSAGSGGNSGTPGAGGIMQFFTSTTTSSTERMRITNAGHVGINTSTPQGLLDVSGALTGTPTTSGLYITQTSMTFTDGTTAASGTAPDMAFNSLARPILAATNTGVTTVNAYGLYMGGSPNKGTNETITNSIAFGIASGNAGGVTNTYSMYINTQSNGTTNYAAVFVGGGFVGIGTATPGYTLDVTGGNLSVSSAGSGLRVKEGSNAKQGTATLAAGTVTVSNTSVTANSRIFLTIQSLGTVVAPQPIGVTARSAGSSFTITSATSTDTSVIAYEIFEPS